MSDDAREVKVTGEDIEGVRTQLAQLAASLPQGQQHVLEWLMQRAAEAPQGEEVSGYLYHPIGPTPGNPGLASQTFSPVHNVNFFSALGVAQLGHMGRIADAGSAISVGGSVMF